MNKPFFRHALAALALLCAAAGHAGEQMPARPLPLPDLDAARVIVKFKAGASTLQQHALPPQGDAATVHAVMQDRADALGGRHGLSLSGGRAITERQQVVTASGISATALAQALARDSEVEYAEVDHRRTRLAVPNDPLFAPASGTSPSTGQWYLKAPSASVAASINAPGAWDVTTGNASLVVAVVDTGVRFDHPDLAAKLLAGYDMVANTTLAGDGDGRDADASDPGDAVTSSDTSNSLFSSCTVGNSSWHGTMVSGLIGASTDNGIGMAGVGWNVKVLPVRVLGKCYGYDSDIIAGMRWAAGLSVSGVPANTTPARVINMSLGGTGSCSSSYADAISEVVNAGAVVVVAAGNSSGHALGVPANCAGVVAVAGLRQVGTKVGYSDVGPSVTVAAPGGNCVNSSGECLYPILSTTNTGSTTPVTGSAGASYTNGSNYAVGTSFSAPLVSGTVALMLSANPALTPSQVTALLKGSARAFPTSGSTSGIAACHAPNGVDQLECYCTTATCGAGMLDASAAVHAAAATASTAVDASLQARITVSPAIPSPADTVSLSSASSSYDSGRSLAGTVWTLLDGGGIVSGFGGGSATTASGSTTSVVPSGAGSFSVRLTITDDLGLVSSVDSTVLVDPLQAQITVSPATPLVGQTVTLSSAGSTLGSGRSIASIGWSLLAGNGVVSGFSSGTGAATATLLPGAAGTFTVQLTITDDLGKQSAAVASVTVAAAATSSAATSSAATSSEGASGSGGGGATSLAGLLGLLGAVLLLALDRFPAARLKRLRARMCRWWRCAPPGRLPGDDLLP